MDSPSLSSRSAVSSETSRTNGDFINVREALNLVPPFKGNKQEVLAFIGNVDTAFTILTPAKRPLCINSC